MTMFVPSRSTLILSLCFAIVSVLFYRYAEYGDEDESTLERNVIKSWAKFVKPPGKQFQKLAVGINSNIDIIVSGVALLNALNIIPGKKGNHDVLNSLEDLQETFAYYFSRGSAAERSFSDQPVYQKIIQTTETLKDIQHFVGGNAALMAKIASSLFPALKIHFVGPVGPLLQNLMPAAVDIPASCHIPQDEVHLIMEYKVGEKWGSATAPVANRFITSHDLSNAKIVMLEPFFESVKSFQPDLIILSGFQILDSQGPDFFQQRLNKAMSLLKEVPTSIPIHLELASMADKDFVREIIDKIVPNVNSLGLNEQEIVFSSKVFNGPHHEHFDHDGHGQPEIHKISDIMMWFLQSYGRSSNNPNARLTRIHFHSLTFHIVAVLESEWSHVEQATAAGTQVAGLQACDIPQLNEDLVELKIPLKFRLFSGDEERDFEGNNPVLSWRKDGYLFVFSPVLVCRNPSKTVGLGDAISATGLMFSQFHSHGNI